METQITGTTLDEAMTRLSEDTRSYVGKAAVDTAIAAIPVVGGSIVTLMGDIASDRLRERIIEVAKIMTERINALGEAKIEKDYFQTEEFLTLLVLAFEQLRTTHDKRKIRMLGTALANSGNTEFKSETRKELMLRIIRDLSPLEVQTLQNMMLSMSALAAWQIGEDDGIRVPTLSRLVAFGLVAEQFESQRIPPLPSITVNTTENDISRFLNDAIKPPTRRYRISKFGVAFIRFLTEESAKPEES